MSKKYKIKINGEQVYMPLFDKVKQFRFTEDNPYISNGLSRLTKVAKAYVGVEGDLMEFNDKYMRDFHYAPNACNKMALDIDEILTSSINFSRKNYADYFPDKQYPDDVKLVGNSIKSKKMAAFIERFLDVGIRQLLRDEGQAFIESYYEYVSKIYNLRIPLREIASKGKIKKSLEEYKEDVKQITKAGRPKSRQAWYELAIANNLHVDNGDTIYYINTGKAKSHSDIKKITHYYHVVNGEKVEFTKEIDREYKKYKKEKGDTKDILEKGDWIIWKYPNFTTEDEIQMNCILVPREIIEADDDTFCDEENGIEYNTSKYVDMFNKRITPLLVCFSKEIRYDILVNNPKDRKYFTAEQCVLSSGDPNKPSDQDTYEKLMTMEDKEFKFWTTYGIKPPFFEECGMGDWETKAQEYLDRMEQERLNGIAAEKERFIKAVYEMTGEEMANFIEDGVLTSKIMKIVEVDPLTGDFVSVKFPDVIIGTVHDILDRDMMKEEIMDCVEVEV